VTHLRNVVGDETYESLARKGETMSTAAMAAYALDQIDQARAELGAVSKDHICDSRKSVSKLVYPVSGPDPLMYEVGAGLL
jgi:hypothetical protein